MVREFKYRGKTVEELKEMGLNQLIELLPARIKRSLKRGFTDDQKKLLEKIKNLKDGRKKKAIKTHCRNIPIIPEMFGVKLLIHNGKEFVPIEIIPEMIGHKMGEFILTRKPVEHKAPGIGATRSSKFISVK